MKIKNSKVFLVTIGLFSFIAAGAQTPLQPNPEKAKKELEEYSRQQKIKQALAQPLPVPEYNLQKHGDLIIINFSEKATATTQSFFKDFAQKIDLGTDDNLKFISQQKDSKGNVMYRYDQFYKGLPVMAGQLALHEKNSKLRSVDGKLYTGLSINTVPGISKEKAIESAIKFIAASNYMWQNEQAEKELKAESRSDEATYYPKPELMIAPKHGDYAIKNFVLAYKMVIVSETPYQKQEIFVDAQNGEVINTISLIAHSDEPATGQTLYSGPQTFTSDSYNGSFRLRESSQRPINTYNNLNRSDFLRPVDFIDADNAWANQSSVLGNLLIFRVNNRWRDASEGFGFFALPDIFIEITDQSGQLIWGRADNYKSNTFLPVNISLNNLPLLNGSTYTIKIYDADPTANVLLGTFTFTNFTNFLGLTTLSGDGNTCILSGRQATSGALDVHWGMEKTYDYYNNTFGRRSYDGSNSTINSYVHVNKSLIGNNGANAFWDGVNKRMVFGDGDGRQFGSMTSLDIAGHELTHGVVQYNGRGGLTYERESGALNESFADIFGTAIEFSAFGNAGNWLIGEKIYLRGGFLRSMSNPKAARQPDTYRSPLANGYWAEPNCGVPTGGPGGNDYCGVHRNSGVQNKWFYLLSAGGSGTNDIGSHYEVPAITINKAAEIAYFNLTNRLTSNATFNDAYLMSLETATDIGYSRTATEYRANREAWYAVGVAKRPVITSFTPTTGSIGTTVTITGENYTGISYVGFNGVYVPFPQFTVNSETEIVVNVPAGATTGKISIIAGYDTVESEEPFVICSGLNATVVSSNATSFTVNANGGVYPYSYSLDNVSFQADSVFSNLATNATYTFYVKDSAGYCTGQTSVFLSDSIQCNVQSGSGGQGTSFITQILGTSPGSVDVNYEMYTIPDQMDIYYNNVLVATTGGLVSGASTLNFNYNPPAGGPYYCTIRLYAPNDGTAWDFIANCPVSTNRVALGKPVIKAMAMEKKSNIAFDAVIYPNPTQSNATLLLSGTKGATSISIADFSGKVVWNTTRKNDGSVLLPVSVLSNGYYSVIISKSSGEMKVLKLLKAK